MSQAENNRNKITNDLAPINMVPLWIIYLFCKR